MKNIVLLEEVAAYSEPDWAMNGGFYNCPKCQHQLYIKMAEKNQVDFCDNCNETHVFLEEYVCNNECCVCAKEEPEIKLVFCNRLGNHYCEEHFEERFNEII